MKLFLLKHQSLSATPELINLLLIIFGACLVLVMIQTIEYIKNSNKVMDKKPKTLKNRKEIVKKFEKAEKTMLNQVIHESNTKFDIPQINNKKVYGKLVILNGGKK